MQPELQTVLTLRNIINHDEQCIKLLHFMLPVGKVRIIVVPISFARLSALWINIVKTSKIFVRFLKFTFLKLISTTTVFLISVACMLELTKFHGIKGNNSFWLQHLSTDTWYSTVNRTLTLKLFKYADWKKSKLCAYLAYELGESFLLKETPFILTL